MTTRSGTTEHPAAPAANQTPTVVTVPATDMHRSAQASSLHLETLAIVPVCTLFPETPYWNLACYPAHCYECCRPHIVADTCLPEDEPCHRNTQNSASLNVINTKCMSINRPCVLTCTR
jgi:hypothetical protein